MTCGIKRILQLQEAIQYQTIKIVGGDNNDITYDCKYSWSSDGVCWTSWADYNAYVKICKNIENDFYLKILLFGDFLKISLNGVYTKCYNICIDSSSSFLTDFCGETNLFQPYNNLDCALQLQQQLSDSVVCMFGIPIYYFRTNPVKDSVDYTFKEYFLHEDEIVYENIGIDSEITYGVELETLGEASMDLLEVGESNGFTIDDKGQERGFLLKRRKKWTFMDNCSRWKFNKWSRNRSCFSNT